jgi:hypothetical protein
MLNSSSRCDRCFGVVKNIDGKRYTIEQLTKIHNEVCPSPVSRAKKPDDLVAAAVEVKEAIA